MFEDYPEDLLLSVKKPSQYLGREPGFPYKDWEKVELRVCLIYPDLYEIGRSHLGLKILSGLINFESPYLCDLAFAVGPDLERELKRRNFPLLSINYRKPLREFEVLGITYAYELLTTSILQILELSKIPFRAEERDSNFPLILGGGPCCGNPEPIAPIFDAIVIGDGEEVLLEILEKVNLWKKEGSDKEELLRDLTKIEGVYVPLLKNFVKRRIFMGKKNISGINSLPIIPLSHDRISVEVSRGCTCSCRFCSAGFYYRPVRERSPEEIVIDLKKGFQETGYREASLMSLSLGNYTGLEKLLELLEKEFYEKKERYFFSLPSLRVGSLTSKILNFLRKGRTSTLTLAIEAGTERLRKILNKAISEEALLRDLSLAQRLGFRRFKFYFILGLPQEREEDLWGIVELFRKLRKTFSGKEFIFSASLFVPKPHTPFQWERQISIEEAFKKIRFLKNYLKNFLKVSNPHQSFLEGVIGRGGRELFPLIERAYQLGARLDSWKEYFDFSLWQKASLELEIDLEAYLQERDIHQPLPWEHIDLGIKKEFFWKEREKALKEEITPDCRWEKCSKCGVCNKGIQNELIKENGKKEKEEFQPHQKVPSREEGEFWIEIYYDKIGPAKFFSQLEVLRLFELSLRRWGIFPVYTQGFNPRPKILCKEASPVGVAVLGEYLALALKEEIEPKLLEDREIFPGLRIRKVNLVGSKKPKPPKSKILYQIKPLSEEIKKKLNIKENLLELPLEDETISIKKLLKDLFKIENPFLDLAITKIYLVDQI